MKRTFEWWKVKLGFQGDPEFLRLAELAPDRRTRQAAVGLLFALYDEAHRKDERTPAGVFYSPADDQLVDLLVAAGLLDAGGGVPLGVWERWRVQDKNVLGGTLRAASADRDDRGRFSTSQLVQLVQPDQRIDRDRERTMSSDKNERKKNDDVSPSRTARGLEPISETLKNAPWNKR